MNNKFHYQNKTLNQVHADLLEREESNLAPLKWSSMKFAQEG